MQCRRKSGVHRPRGSLTVDPPCYVSESRINLVPFARFQVDTSTSGCYSVSRCKGSHEGILQPKLLDLLQLKEKWQQCQTARRQECCAPQRAAQQAAQRAAQCGAECAADHLQRLQKLLHCKLRKRTVLLCRSGVTAAFYSYHLQLMLLLQTVMCVCYWHCLPSFFTTFVFMHVITYLLQLNLYSF